jgi:hypothetical protein
MGRDDAPHSITHANQVRTFVDGHNLNMIIEQDCQTDSFAESASQSCQLRFRDLEQIFDEHSRRPLIHFRGGRIVPSFISSYVIRCFQGMKNSEDRAFGHTRLTGKFSETQWSWTSPDQFKQAQGPAHNL